MTNVVTADSTTSQARRGKIASVIAKFENTSDLHPAEVKTDPIGRSRVMARTTRSAVVSGRSVVVAKTLSNRAARNPRLHLVTPSYAAQKTTLGKNKGSTKLSPDSCQLSDNRSKSPSPANSVKNEAASVPSVNKPTSPITPSVKKDLAVSTKKDLSSSSAHPSSNHLSPQSLCKKSFRTELNEASQLSARKRKDKVAQSRSEARTHDDNSIRRDIINNNTDLIGKQGSVAKGKGADHVTSTANSRGPVRLLTATSEDLPKTSGLVTLLNSLSVSASPLDSNALSTSSHPQTADRDNISPETNEHIYSNTLGTDITEAINSDDNYEDTDNIPISPPLPPPRMKSLKTTRAQKCAPSTPFKRSALSTQHTAPKRSPPLQPTQFYGPSRQVYRKLPLPIKNRGLPPSKPRKPPNFDANVLSRYRISDTDSNAPIYAAEGATYYSDCAVQEETKKTGPQRWGGATARFKKTVVGGFCRFKKQIHRGK